MPHLGKRVRMVSQTLAPCLNKKPTTAENSDLGDCNSAKTELLSPTHDESNGDRNLRVRGRMKKPGESRSFSHRLRDWVSKKGEMGVPESKLFLPFLVGAPKLAECRVCQNVIYLGEEVSCSVLDCQGSYHLTCARDLLGLLASSKDFKCPRHACFLCKKKSYSWQCSICHLASHDKCAAYPEYVLYSHDRPGKTICWRHATDWSPLKPAVPTNSIEELFSRLPLPCLKEGFKVDLMLKDTMVNESEPPPYVHINRNIYLIKKKLDNVDGCIGCTGSSSPTCLEDCVCRLQCISCSSACGCSEMCTNRPFEREKKTRIVMTDHCGWGLEAAESIEKDDFIIEYVGEVINDNLCAERFWAMKNQGVKNFYMCEVRKDFTIDATFKGNEARFLNHSCDPNCNLEKWDVDGETRLGVFAARSIKAGEPLTYHYRFVQFGASVECHCGASNCQGYLGTKKKVPFRYEPLDWGAKRQRSAGH